MLVVALLVAGRLLVGLLAVVLPGMALAAG